MPRILRSSPLALAVLMLLYEAPMHPYRMQKLIKERGKDLVINVARRASLYQMIGTLERAGLIAVHAVQEQENLPERTLYALTEEGRQTALDWLRAILATPAEDFPNFPAAVSFMMVLPPEDVLAQLTERQKALEVRRAFVLADMESAKAIVPRLFLLESEYMLAMLDAELAWVQGVLADLHSGELTWSKEMLERVAQQSKETQA